MGSPPPAAPARALALAALSALIAASHESVAPSLLARWTGNSAWATGLALGVFMAGLGAGSLLPVYRPGLLARPRRAYGLAEVAVALSALGALAVFTRATPPSTWLSASHAVDVAAAALVMLPSALAMGLTYPLMVASLRGSPRAAGAVYAAGLVGACAGVTACAGAVVPRVGGTAAALVAVCGNLIAAAVSTRWLPDAEGAVAEAPPLDRATLDAAALFAATGVFGLGAQAVWNRALVPYAGVSTFAFAAIVAAYVGAQALGFALVRRVAAARVREVASWALALAPAACLATLALCAAVSSGVGSRDGAPWPWALATLAAVTVVVAPCAVMLGAGQAAALASIEASPQRARSAAIATGIGTLVSAAGSVVAALALVPRIGPRWTLAALALPLVGALARSGARRHAAVGAALAVALAWAAPGPRYFLGAEYDRAAVLYARFGVQDTAAVVLHDQPVEPAIRHLVAAGVSYSGDSLFAQRYMRLLAHLPALAATGRDRALVICVGTGTTLDALRTHDFSRVVAVDIDPTIRDTLSYFARAHRGAPDDPRVRLVVDDGDRFLAASRAGAYDVITLEPPPPRAPGGSTLYTEEFYARARDALRPGGAVAQWLPLHDMGAWEADAIVATFLKVFPDASLHLAERNEAILLSRHEGGAPTLSAEVRGDLARIGADDDPLADTLWLDADALRALTRGAPVITRAWPAPELAPLSVPQPFIALDAWAERAAGLATPASRDTSAGVVGPVVGAFLRVKSGAGRGDDRARVTAAMGSLLRARPDNVYWQYAHGFGPHLTDRLAALAREGVNAAVLARAARRIEALRARAPR